MGVNLRKVKIGDEKTLAFIQTESWKYAFKDIISKEDLEECTNIDKAIEMYKSLLEKEIGNGYILFVDDKAHLMAYFDEARDTEAEGFAELICIHSLRENLGKGYGKVMMNHILAEAKNQGYSKIYLWVFEENKRARRFYESFDFKETDNKKEFLTATEVMYLKEL
ncbi:GNAT family N-acetyltransferase [Clostridium chrysemydis]|uniref:GNAT family N-acetyltransferase n=1 Tax=Clostridium chrysemydis TaxID=2665504 RepID=UPI0018835F0D